MIKSKEFNSEFFFYRRSFLDEIGNAAGNAFDLTAFIDSMVTIKTRSLLTKWQIEILVKWALRRV